MADFFISNFDLNINILEFKRFEVGGFNETN